MQLSLTQRQSFRGKSRCIMSKYEIEETFDLNKNKVEIPDTLFQRHLGSVILRTPIGKIQFTGLHLCANHGNRFRENTRMKELDVMLSYVQNCDSCVANIVAGDFNSKPFSNPYNKMISCGFIDTHKDIIAPTVPVPDSESRIDYIFIDEKSKITFSTDSIRVPYYSDLELFLSDHQPCMKRLINE